MAKQNTKAFLAALMAGTPTKETEALRAITTGEAIRENIDLPSASQMNFKRVVVDGKLQMVEESAAANMKSNAHISTDAIMGLLSGKKVSEINAELEEKRLNEQKSVSQSISRPSNTSQPILNETKVFSEDIEELIENKVYDILGSIVGQVNDNLKNKELIKQKLVESITFIKLTESLKK